MAQTVIGIFDSPSEAQTAVTQLTNSGFTRSDIDIASRNTSTGTGSTTTDTTYQEEDTDSIGDFFKSLFGADDDENYSNSRRYSEVAKRGTVVTVHAKSSEEASRAADILDQYGAVDIDERASQYSSGSTGTSTLGGAATGVTGMGAAATAGLDDTTASTHSRTTHSGEAPESSIPIIEENLQVGKREVESGGVRLRSRIVERPVEEHLRLREERVWVERTPVDRTATDADFSNVKEGEFELREHNEVPVVSKEARVVEEVSFGKEVEERDETIRETLRKTDVDVERLDQNLDSDINRGTTNRTTGTGTTGTGTAYGTDADTDYDDDLTTNRPTGI